LLTRVSSFEYFLLTGVSVFLFFDLRHPLYFRGQPQLIKEK
jgi:hypothetical protein